jgi:hypothetical protein
MSCRIASDLEEKIEETQKARKNRASTSRHTYPPRSPDDEDVAALSLEAALRAHKGQCEECKRGYAE